jgi:hypothetical protein
VWPTSLQLCGKSRDRFLGAFTTVRKATLSCVMFVSLSVRLSVCQSAWNNSVPTGPIFIKLYTLLFFENPFRIFNCHYNSRQITGTLHEDVRVFVTVSRSILLIIRNAVKIKL